MLRRDLHGIHFLRVKGTFAERTLAHAKLMKDEILDGAIPALVKKNEWLIRRSPLLNNAGAIQHFVVGFYRRVLIPLLDSKTPEGMKEAMRLASNESGIPYDHLREILFQADGLMLLIRASFTKHFLPEWIPGGIPGCTSGVALKEQTANGKMLTCRNFDYVIVGPWEKYPTVVFNEPTEPGSIPFICLTSAGIPSGGVTSMNREGITLAAHAHFGKKVSFRGNSVISIGEEVISHAKTIGQAVDIIKKRKSCANWAFVISSAKENDAIVAEITPNRVSVRHPRDGVLAHSNFFHDRKLHEGETLFCGSYCEDLEARYQRMRKTLLRHPGSLEPQHLTQAMGEQVDYFTGEERIVGNTLGVCTTIKSVVFEPESQIFWMANRHESPVGLGDYLQIDINRFWDQPEEEAQKNAVFLPGYKPSHPKLISAMSHYRNAYRSYQMESHLENYREKALEELKKATKEFPEDGHLWIQTGLFAFMMGKFDVSEEYLKGSYNYSVSKHVKLVRSLYEARLQDLKGERKEALRVYKENQNTQEPRLAKAFRKGIRRRYREKDIARIHVDLQFPDHFEY